MTTALQKFDIGRVYPTATDMVRLLGSGIEEWVANHTDAVPANGSTNLALSGGIYNAINSIGSSLNTLNTNLDNIIATKIGAELAAGMPIGDAISSAIHTAIQSENLAQIRETLVQQGLDISGFIATIATKVDAAVTTRMNDYPNLNTQLATLDAIANLDMIKELLDHTDGGVIILDKITLIKVSEGNHQVLDLREEGTLNREYYCIVDDGSGLTIVFPDADYTEDGLNKLNNGDNAYIEYRSTSDETAPVVNILTDSQYDSEHPGTPRAGSTSILFGVLTSDNGLDPYAMYTRIRATYCYGKWMAEVVQFKDSAQEELSKYDVVYEDNYTGLDWGFTAGNILKGSYQLAGKQANYCGMEHTGWNTRTDGSGTAYALGQTIILDDGTTEAGTGAGANRKLVLYARYAPHTQTFRGNVDWELRHGAYRAGTSGIYGPAAYPIYNESAFHDAVAGWGENTIKIQISFVWAVYAYNNTLGWVSAKIGDNEHKLENLRMANYWTDEPNAFTITLQRNASTDNFVLPTVITAASEGAVIPYISGIIFE